MLREEVFTRIRKAGIHPDRELSQHFLIDDSVLAQIIRSSLPLMENCVVEIGAGVGTLTEALLKRSGKVIAYEPDEKMAAFLRRELTERYPNLEIREKFINRYELDALLDEFGDEEFSIVSNLPYSITSEFLLWLIAHSSRVRGTIVMLQNEVVKRLTASPGSKSYGALSVYAQSFVYTTEILFVPRSSFYPVPNVDSHLVSIKALSEQPELSKWDIYYRVVEGAFKHRRKTILNALIRTFPHIKRSDLLKILAKLDILPDERGENLSKEDFIRLTQAMFEV